MCSPPLAPEPWGVTNGSDLLLTVLMFVFFLVSLAPYIAVAVRPLHDVNMSGWFYLLGLIPFIGGLILVVLMVLPAKPDGARFDR